MYYLNDDVIFVRGSLKGAIYDFSSGKVYWISKESCDLIENLVNTGESACLCSEEQDYVCLLKRNNLYNPNKAGKYTPKISTEQKLELAWLEITQACNCKCLHCYQGEKHVPVPNTLSITDWKRVIDELKQMDVSRVVVIGGEPCTHKYINEILMYLYKSEINTTLFTNATIIRPDLLKLITERSDKISVKVSLYADNAVDHDFITQCPGSFDKLVATVKKLTSNGVVVNIAVVAMRENQDKLSNIEKFVASLGANYSKFDVIRNVFGGTQDQHTPTDPKIINSCMFCEPNFKANKQRFHDNISKNSCWYGKIAVTETGDVIPCVFERNVVYGNVMRNTICEIMQSEHLKHHWYFDFGKVDYCKDCEFRFSCKDCRPLGISVEGKITTKNPRCKYNPHLGEWL